MWPVQCIFVLVITNIVKTRRFYGKLWISGISLKSRRKRCLSPKDGVVFFGSHRSPIFNVLGSG